MIWDIEQYILQGARSVNSLLDKLEVHYIEEEMARTFSPNWDMFLNLNTKEDLEYFLKIIGREELGNIAMDSIKNVEILRIKGR